MVRGAVTYDFSPARVYNNSFRLMLKQEIFVDGKAKTW